MLDVRLGTVDGLVVDDFTGRLIGVTVLNVGLAVGRERPLHKASALLVGNFGAGIERAGSRMDSWMDATGSRATHP